MVLVIDKIYILERMVIMMGEDGVSVIISVLEMFN